MVWLDPAVQLNVQGAVQFEPSTVMVMPLTDEVTVIETLPPPLMAGLLAAQAVKRRGRVLVAVLRRDPARGPRLIRQPVFVQRIGDVPGEVHPVPANVPGADHSFSLQFIAP
jgi:hypothetical protein